MTNNVERSREWAEQKTPVAGIELSLIRGGSGQPLLVLHEELGAPGWLEWHSALARERLILIPLHPGFGRTPRVEWISNLRDLACFYARFLREQALAPIDVIGFSLGGWLAAEMAVNDPRQFRKMVLVAPAGIRPPRGEIMDMFMLPAQGYLRASVRDPQATAEFATLYGGGRSAEQFEAWEDARAETARLAWQPYLFNPSLPHLLEGVSGLPTLLIWGRDDSVVPLSAGEAYAKSIAGSKLVVFDHCGHRPEIERPADFIKQVRTFIS
jgi:pimeloyl-ACP methyl ester carboxylesterase